MIFFLPFFLSWALSNCSFAQTIEGDVAVYKYWHLSPGVNTTNILSSKKLPQYQNQKQVYRQIDKLLKKRKFNLIVSEGCEGEIDENFSGTFNGWSYADLKRRLRNSNYEDILTLVPLKLEVKYQKQVKTVCGDSLKLIKECSDLFNELEITLRQITSAHNAAKKAQFEEKRKKGLSLIDQIKKKISERNHVFLNTILAHLPDNPVVILGGGHLEGVTDLLYAQKKIAFKVVETPGYPQEDEHHLERLRQEIKDLSIKN